MLEAFRVVKQTLAAEEWLRRQETALREAVAQTETSQSLAVYSYRQGFIEIMTLLYSYRGALNAQSAHLRVKNDRSVIVSLCTLRSVGLCNARVYGEF